MKLILFEYKLMRNIIARESARLKKREGMAEFERDCCIRGYHQYKEVLAAAIGETLSEPTNPSDRYAVAVVRSGTIVGHFPRKI